MMRTVEVLLVVIILGAAYVSVSSLVALPSPSDVSPVALDRLALTTLQQLDSHYDLSSAVFQTGNVTEWGNLQVALSACLPPNMAYNLSVYNVNTASDGASLYSKMASFSNAPTLGADSGSSSRLVASSNVTYKSTPQKIYSNDLPVTLYILNCSDSAGWWITGYTPSSLAETVQNLLTPYFETTIIVQNTNELNQLINGQSLQGEFVNNSIIINTNGEAVPIPSQFQNSDLGYDSTHNSYAKFDYTLGQRTQLYNWTWVSIVGWPFYYVTNTGFLSGTQNTWGIYGMNVVGSQGLTAFLQGLDNQPYSYTGSSTGSPGQVYLSSQAQELCNYYGLYPSVYQTSTRALPTSIVQQYNLAVSTYLFNTTFGGSQYNPGAVYRHLWTTRINGVDVKNYQGGFFALGMSRIPDIRLTALGILSDYQPVRYGSLYTTQGSNRLVVLQLGIVGGS